MSGKHKRARQRRARKEKVRAEFERLRNDPQALADWLRLLAESDLCLWAVAEAAGALRPLDDDERALITQAVAPRLVGMKPLRQAASGPAHTICEDRDAGHSEASP